MPQSPERRDDHLLAAQMATDAGRLLMDLRAEMVAAGAEPAELRSEGDRRAHLLLMERLAEDCPGDAVLSEEGRAEEGREGRSRLEANRVWIIDPLDGTREYGEVPRADWAVHVALVVGGRLAVGAVALPAQRITLCTRPQAPMPPPPPTRPRVIVSRSRPPAIATALAEALGGDLVEMGSAGAKVAAVVMGAADVYAHSGGQYEWDSAAPVAVAHAAGLHTSRLDGTALVYNNPDPYLPDLLVCHPRLADAVLAITSSTSG